MILGGNLAPRGAVIKHTAASPHLLQHRGTAYVFENYKQMHEADRFAGPAGHAGYGAGDEELRPEGRAGLSGMGPDSHAAGAARSGRQRCGPDQRCAHERHQFRDGGAACRAGIRRRRSAGAVETGDEVELDTAGAQLTLHVPEDEIARRLDARRQPQPHYERGYGWMFLQHVNQADEGCDFDFLRKTS